MRMSTACRLRAVAVVAEAAVAETVVVVGAADAAGIVALALNTAKDRNQGRNAIKSIGFMFESCFWNQAMEKTQTTSESSEDDR